MADTKVDAQPADNHMRITTAGNVAAYAAYALKFLSTNSGPLVLTTRPNTTNGDAGKEKAGEKETETAKGGLHQATLAAPRLVSVVEKVKRAHPGQLYQYTESGLLEPVGVERPSLERVLGGKTKPKMTHRPYLQITLATRPLGLETRRNVTLQRGNGVAGEKPKTKTKAKAQGKAAVADSGDGGDAEGVEEEREGEGEGEGGDGQGMREALAPPAASGTAGDRRVKRKSQVDDGPSKRPKK